MLLTRASISEYQRCSRRLPQLTPSDSNDNDRFPETRHSQWRAVPFPVVLLVNRPVPCKLISERFSCANDVSEKLSTIPTAMTTTRFMSKHTPLICCIHGCRRLAVSRFELRMSAPSRFDIAHTRIHSTSKMKMAQHKWRSDLASSDARVLRRHCTTQPRVSSS